MGWISDKFQREGRAKWGKPISADKRRAPLRKIVAVVHARTSLFDSDLVDLECGHTARAFGDLKARCVKCLREREDLADQAAERDRPKPDPITGLQPGRLTEIIR